MASTNMHVCKTLQSGCAHKRVPLEYVDATLTVIAIMIVLLVTYAYVKRHK